MRAFFHVILVALMCAAAGPGAAGDRTALGMGALFSNDSIVDGQDRWRTGAVQYSYVIGRAWDGRLPEHIGDIVEFRFGAEIIAPSNLVAPAPAPADRRFVGAVTFGVHSHWRKRNTELMLGGGATFTGSHTHLDDLQREFHRIAGFPVAGPLVDQIANAVYPRAEFEAGQLLQVSGTTLMRPFVALEAGPETFARAGVDVHLKGLGAGDMLVRDSTTGQLYRATHKAPRPRLGFTVGGDVARVVQSRYLRADDGHELTPLRSRVRAGMHFRSVGADGFAGVSFLGREFERQREGQLVGSVRFRINF
ncbi:lipid A-modifier LpxR family protein [Aliiroseovarius sp. PTFE2010]|uniref:lipid A-modifier LpxR family protein n=1 Tax=Aliiroseovarius sp. PTFE2010 TaxID=3417190 RepID=UPI003CF443B9